MRESVVSPAADFAVALLREFVSLGVTDAVLTPGSRSQGLALALAAFDSARMLDLQVRIDERSAAFTALGLGVETGHPAIVVTTSGTAVANLLPAVLEASHSGVPMLLLTSDRPSDARGTGGNQTTWQPGLFGRFVRLAVDVDAPTGDPAEPRRAADLARAAVDAALGTHTGTPGPVHLNLQFREPLSGPMPALSAVSEPLSVSVQVQPSVPVQVPVQVPLPADVAAAELVAPAALSAPIELPRGPRTVVVAGHGAGPAAEELAHQGGWPLLAEASSGSRYGRNLVIAYRELLNDPGLGGLVQRVIVFGHPTLSREVPALSLRDGVETIVVTPAALALSSPATARERFAIAPEPGGEPAAPEPALTLSHLAASEPASAVPPDVYNPGHRVTTFVTEASVPPATGDVLDAEREWLRSWVLTSRSIVDAQSDDVAPPNVEAARSPNIADRRDYRVTELAALRTPISRRMLGLAVWRATWPHDRLILGASRLIRDLDRAAPGKKITVHANRGLAGIDGTIATATGIALASQRSRFPGVKATATATAAARTATASGVGVTRVLLGDLTLLHDVGSMLFGAGERRPRIQLIVANDQGGTIFDTLEVAATADRTAFDRVMITPHTADLEALAKAYGWHYTRATTRAELDAALTAPVSGPTLLEVPLQR
ncbi:2-succinyl-5-enolpyruvyl-6-hydroxy-3-cyclohexene-1-carboxylic-acid synthase [Subtercola vilae]|uniref:2-succinyl-5-enolpyruvyl-6-hydroxy-3- cyclohexene-1-carboxylic-acid synthase n=1 Tax=Subtercola vilae TaxID=2056433 RepID=UPI00191E28C0|nr:2-succinyl-5-enolpyruvyl-6-hydroxy-3-cyclohexene-1-carboxylic-acid synthase [Subtercola vilae]